MVYLAGPAAITCSVPSFRTHEHTPHHLFLPPPVELGALLSPRLWMAVSRTWGKSLPSLHAAVPLPSLVFCPRQEGREDVVGLDPSTEPAQAGPSSQEGGGPQSALPAQALRPWAPLTPVPTALLPFGALGITPGA